MPIQLCVLLLVAGDNTPLLFAGDSRNYHGDCSFRLGYCWGGNRCLESRVLESRHSCSRHAPQEVFLRVSFVPLLPAADA